MKRRKFIIFALLITLSLFLVTACTSDDDDDNGSTSGTDLLDPEDAHERDLSFHVILTDMDLEYNQDRNSSHIVMITAVKPDYYEVDITVSVNGQEVEDVYGMFQTWMFEYGFNEGENYLLEIATDLKNFSRTIKVPYRITTADFPESYDPSQSASISWTLAGNNENQLITARSEHHGDEDMYDEWYKELTPSQRTYTIDSNVVDDYGDDGYYTLSVMQVNFSMDDDMVVFGISGQHSEYGRDWTIAAEDALKWFNHYIESRIN